jgi:hypothetical protein
MKALATLSKFLGCYDKWKEIVQNYQLKWSDSGNVAGFSKGLEIFQKIYGNDNYQEMIIQLKDECLDSTGNIHLFCYIVF